MPSGTSFSCDFDSTAELQNCVATPGAYVYRWSMVSEPSGSHAVLDNPAAQRLYERKGYRRFGLKSGYYEDGADALRYEKALIAAVG